ncbi:GGDEF domain-containing protein [Sporomusa aerivorans]|uniref:GGDEF domain-containing protein n=1 Tax=Sporomusa aerivorans TaxID=204936 RepID=UPI00352B7325
MLKKYIVVNVLDGLRYIQNLVSENQGVGFPVMEDNQIVGVLTYKDLLQSHPNRIAADAMSGHIVYIDAHSSIWKAKEMFDSGDTDLLLVQDNNQLVGIITKSLLEAELGKHIDLLTGLPKKDFIYYNAIRLLESKQEMSFAFFDVNNFGLIDKVHGHVAGDIILQEIGTILKANMTDQTYVSRFGGDEFLVLTPYYVDKCYIFAQNLLRAISRYSFHNNIPVTVSAGIAEKKETQECSQNILGTISNLINLASLASTKAKKDKCELSVAANYTTCNFAG